MRGRQRVKVVAALVGAGAGSGALVGFALGVGWLAARLPAATSAVAGFAALATVSLDVATRRLRWFRRLRPLSVQRQVPVQWAHVFAPAPAAFLYGARLGVGPLTILPTWMWWTAILLAASAGPFAGAAVGALFGVSRLGVVVLTSLAVERRMTPRVARLRRLEPSVMAVVFATAVAVGAAALLVPAGGSTSRTRREVAAGVDVRPDPLAPRRVSAPAAAPAPAGESAAGALADVLVPTGPDSYEAVPEGRAGLGALDLAAAAAVEDDPAAERALLETRRFRAGYARAWRGPDDVVAYALVYEFADESGAAAYLADGLITLEGRGAQLYPVLDVAGARGFSQVERRDAGAVVSHGVAWARGRLFFLVFRTGSASTVTTADAAAFAVAQDRHAAGGRARS